jgi:Ca2+-binding RTX toxin-like protein
MTARTSIELSKLLLVASDQACFNYGALAFGEKIYLGDAALPTQRLYYVFGSDTAETDLEGGTQSDILLGSPGSDVLFGGGQDLLIGGNDTDLIIGKAKNDSIWSVAA